MSGMLKYNKKFSEESLKVVLLVANELFPLLVFFISSCVCFGLGSLFYHVYRDRALRNNPDVDGSLILGDYQSVLNDTHFYASVSCVPFQDDDANDDGLICAHLLHRSVDVLLCAALIGLVRCHD